LDKTTIRSNAVYLSEYDCRRVLYVFKVLRAIIDCDIRLFMQHVSETNKPISKDILELNKIQTTEPGQKPEGSEGKN